MSREFGTCMESKDLYIDQRMDKNIQFSGEYFDSEKWADRREKKALYIQCCVRGWFARKLVNELKHKRYDQERQKLEKKEMMLKDQEEKHKKEIERRMQPRTQEDFKVLYQELEIWRNNETQKIKNNDSLNDEERNIALNVLLKKEVRLLQTIDRLKNQAGVRNKQERVVSFLETISAPKRWVKNDGQAVIVDTPFTTRARELYDL